MASYWGVVCLIQLVVFGSAPPSVSGGAIDRISGEDAAVIAEHLLEEMGKRRVMKDIVDAMTKKIELLEERLDKVEGLSDSSGRNSTKRPGQSAGSGVTYVRWGRTTCREGTDLVYKGYVGGSYYNHPGGAANSVCLTEDPTWTKYTEGHQPNSAEMHGVEYRGLGYDFSHFFGQDLEGKDIPCAVCWAPRSAVMMIPGTHLCTEGWTREYGGYLFAGYTGYPSASEYICMDADSEPVVGGTPVQNGKLLYFVQAKCGLLRCGPYKEGRELTCTVCTR